jgi:hypothetical protein
MTREYYGLGTYLVAFRQYWVAALVGDEAACGQDGCLDGLTDPPLQGHLGREARPAHSQSIVFQT